MRTQSFCGSVLVGLVPLVLASVAGADPARAKIMRCVPVANGDPTGNGVGHSPAVRKVNVQFAYATRTAADDAQKAAVATATTRVELCIVDSMGTATCNAATDPSWLLYDSTTKPGGLAPTAANLLNSGQGALPAGIAPLSFEVPAGDYADAANNGKFVILKVNGESNDDARNLGGTCPLPYPIQNTAHFELYGTEDTIADPWAGKGFGPQCSSSRIDAGTEQCVSPVAAQNLLLEFEGTIGWQTGRFGAPANLDAWRNGDDPAVCGGVCKGHTWVHPIDFLGFNLGPGRSIVATGLANDLVDWFAGYPLTTITHEMFHALQARYPAWLHVGFVEGSAESLERNICLQNIAQLPGRCIASGQLGAPIESVGDGLSQPRNNVLSFPYESGLYWRYFMEQYALPLATGGFARPAGGQASTLQSNPLLPLGDVSRNADEGSDLLRLVLEAVVASAGSGTTQPPLLQLADTVLSTRLQRNLDNLLLDYHTAILLKDYPGTPPEWRLDWVGDYNAGAAAPLHAAAPAPALPIEQLKPFALSTSPRRDDLPRVHRVVDRVNLGPADSVANGTEEVLNAYGSAYLSVVPTTPNSIVTVRLRPAHHGAPRFRVFTVDATNTPTLVAQCAQEVGANAGRMRVCGSDANGNVSVDIATGSGATAVSEILVVASASAQPVSFFYQIGAAAPDVEMAAPSTGQPVWAGTPNPGGTVRPFLAKFVVRDASGNAVPGLSTNQIRLSAVSGATSTTITDVRLLPLSGGVYFARATLPPAALPNAAGTLDLRIEYLDQAGTTVLATSNQPAALTITGTPPTVATQVLIDLSDSMNEDGQKKLIAVKEAATFLLDSIPNGDEVGIITYNHDADTRAPLDILDDARRTALQTDIQGLVAAGCTSLGDPLLEAQSNFNARFAGAAPLLNILMLSDGINTAHHTPSYYYAPNAPQLPEQQDGAGTTTCGLADPNPNDTAPWQAGSLKWSDQAIKPRVTTIAFGQNADLVELSNAAASTQGVFLYADEGGVGQVGVGSHELADAYRQGYNLAAQRARIGASRVESTDDLPDFRVEQQAQHLQVSLFSRLSAPSTDLFLVAPDGTLHSAAHRHDKTAVYRVPSPQPGMWSWFLDEDEGPIVHQTSVADAPPIFVEQAVYSPLVLLAVADVESAVSGRFATDDERWVGKDVFVRAVPTDGGDVLNASVQGVLQYPTGSTADITLLDDGLSGDGAANDGVYGTVIRDARVAGAYTVKLKATGVSSKVGQFERETSVGFSLHDAPDTDGDGVPDFADADPNVPDSGADPDEDGLTNGEEFEHGTDPLQADSDGGGETDGSEIAGGLDPRDPSDDSVDAHTIHVSPCFGKVLITPEVPVYEDVEVEVSHDGPLGPYSLVYSGLAEDQFEVDAPFGDSQCYRMRTLGFATSAWSPPYCITTDTGSEDPHPPTLSVALTNGTTWARSRRAKLALTALDTGEDSHLPRCSEAVVSGVKDMQIAFTADFAGAVWEPYTPIVSIDLPATGDVFGIWVKVRDGAGNESQPAFVNLRIAKPVLDDFLLYGVTAVHLEDGVRLVAKDGGPGALANQGNTQTEIGAQASTGDVFSKSPVFLRSSGTIDGYVQTGNVLTQQAGSVVTGTIAQNAVVTLPGLPNVVINPGTGPAVSIEPNQSQTLVPGNYGDVIVKSNATLTLQSGTYRMRLLQTEPGARLVLNKSTGPVRIQMQSFQHRGQVVEAGGFYGQTLFAASGTNGIFIEGPFTGTLLAPNAAVTIGTGVAQEHWGAFQARSILVRSKAMLYHRPWNYAGN